MNDAIRIKISEEDCLMLEKCWYEYNGLFLLITQFTSDSPYKPDKERYEQVLHNYLESFLEYNMVLQVIISKYVDNMDLSKKTCTVDFIQNELLFNKKECNCSEDSCEMCN